MDFSSPSSGFNFDNDPDFNPRQQHPNQFNPGDYKHEQQFQETNMNQMLSQGIDDIEDPPLLEELGIDLGSMKTRLFQVIKLGFGTEKANFEDTDLTGPLVICILFGVFLMMVNLICIIEWKTTIWLYLWKIGRAHV